MVSDRFGSHWMLTLLPVDEYEPSLFSFKISPFIRLFAAVEVIWHTNLASNPGLTAADCACVPTFVGGPASCEIMVFRTMYKGTRIAATTARMSKPSRSGRIADGVDDRLPLLEASFIAIASFSECDSSFSSHFWQQESILSTCRPVDRLSVDREGKRLSVIPSECGLFCPGSTLS